MESRYVVRSRFEWLFIPALAGLIGLYLAIFVYYVAATVITVPYLDLLEWILRYDQYWRAGDWWHYFWLPHNGHRLVWSLILVLADIECCRGSTLPFLLFDSICFLLTIGGPLWVIWVADLAIQLKAILAAAVILLLAASWAVIYCSVPIEGDFVHTTGFFVLALVLLEGVGERRVRRHDPKSSRYRCCGARCLWALPAVCLRPWCFCGWHGLVALAEPG